MENEKEEKPIGYILFHPGLFCVAFDVFVRIDMIDKIDIDENDFYEVPECKFVQWFLRNNPDYLYIGSEDFCHIPDFNAGVQALVEELVEKGFKVIFADMGVLNADRKDITMEA